MTQTASPLGDHSHLRDYNMASSFDPAEIDGRVDARPILYRSEKNAWERTERLRTSLYREMETICEQLGIEALVLQSEPYVHPTWVRFVSWLPVDSQGMTARSAMTVTITTLPYRNYEALYKVEWEKHGQSGSIAQLYALGPTQVRELLIALSAPPTSSSTRTHLHAILKPVQLRQAWWHLWRPTNKIKAVRRDWLRIGSGVSIAFGLIVLLGPTLIGLLFLLAGGIGFISANRRPQIVRSAGKPLAEPRILFYLDAWQTVVFDAGPDAQLIRERLSTLFHEADQQRFTCRAERIWRWGLDGKTEREQLILNHGRGLVFCQIYAYGSDLYVGWDAHLNLGTWKEEKLASGLDRETGQRVLLMEVERAVQATTEYDLVDLNCLLEWAHAQVTKVIKQYLDERQIDQEVDFTIIRGDRQNATEVSDEKEKQGGAKKAFRFLRRA